MGIVPLGLGRSSIALQNHRASSSLAGSSSIIARIEQQIYTQRQYQHGSDSPFNATTTLAIQAQVERKTQNASNLQTTLTFLTATSSTFSKFNPLTDEAKGYALEALETAVSAEQRTSLAQTVSETLKNLVDFSNYTFEGRYVFAGAATSTLPFTWGSDSSYTLKYNGSLNDLHSWSDTDLLSKSNIAGDTAFGAVSNPMRGEDLNTALTGKTLLSDLNGGKGIDKGALRFTYTADNQVRTVDIDLSKCVTVEDVQRTIEKSNNTYFSVNVDLTEKGMVFSMPESAVGSLRISEVGRGTVARQLGIPTETEFNRNQSLLGTDLDPALTKTTPLNNLLGTRSTLELRFAGANNNILIQANHNGADYDGIKVSLQADATLSPGQTFTEYDRTTNELLLRIHPDNTSANDIIKAINDASVAGTIPSITASFPGGDLERSELAGTGVVSFLPGTLVSLGSTSGGSGADLDLTGIELVNDNQVHNISFTDCKTVGDLLVKLNDPKYGLYAAINDAKSGIDIRSRVSGADFCIGENGGTTASQLGVRSLDLDTRLEAFDFGRGVTDYTGPGTSASATYSSVSANSALRLTSKFEGSEWNDYTMNFVPTTDPQGKVIVSMDETAKIITIGINPGVTTACEIVSAFETQPGPKELFNLTLDTSAGVNNGSGVVYDGFATTSGGTNGGIDFTVTRNDGTVLEIDIHGAETMEDVLRIINEHPNNRDGMLTATLSTFGNGIELLDKSFGTEATRVDRTLLSTTAIELGLINLGEEYQTKTVPGEYASATINSGVPNGTILVKANGVGTYANGATLEFIEGTPPGFMYDAASKTLRFTVEPGVTTANDVIELFQSQASDQVRAMFDLQNGVNTDGLPSDGSGLIALETQTLTGGADSVLKGNDPNPQETASLFNALIRLQKAMENNDTREMERAAGLLDAATANMNAAQATLGTMQSSLDSVADRLEDEQIQFEATLNLTLRIDYPTLSMEYLSQQTAYQGAMQISSMMFQNSLLNYL